MPPPSRSRKGKPPSSRTHQPTGLGDSWGTAEYASESDASVRSASDLTSEEDGSEFEFEDKATPLPKRLTRASSQTPQTTPVTTASQKMKPRHSQSPRSASSAYSNELLEPSFIMPSPNASVDNLADSSTMRRPGVVHQRRPKRPSSSAQKITDRAVQSPQLRSPARSSVREVSPASSKSSKSSSRSSKSSKSSKDEGTNPWFWLWDYLIKPVGGYIASILGIILHAMKAPLAAFVIGIVLYQASSYARRGIINTLAPVCSIPGSSYLIPFCTFLPDSKPDKQGPPFEELIKVQSDFEDVLSASSEAYTLPSDMKRSEAGIRDLNMLVKYSKLPSKSQLEGEMDTFIQTAREVATELTHFNTRINRAIDRVLSTNLYTYRMMNRLSARSQAKGELSRIIDNINPWYIVRPPKSIERLVFDQYIKHTDAIEIELASLIKQAQTLLLGLNILEEQIANIANIAARDSNLILEDQDDLLAELWTKLGGNRAKVRNINGQLALLKEVTIHRKRAWGHVTATLMKLQSISAGLEDLRERVATPSIVGFRHDSEFPLEYYLDVVNQGAQRLESVRVESQYREKEAIWKMGRPEGEGEEKLLGPGRGWDRVTKTVTAGK